MLCPDLTAQAAFALSSEIEETQNYQYLNFFLAFVRDYVSYRSANLSILEILAYNKSVFSWYRNQTTVIFPHRLKLSFCESQEYLFPFKTLANSAVEIFIGSGNVGGSSVHLLYYNSAAPYSYSPPHQYAIKSA
jgi:hypothetical protein